MEGWIDIVVVAVLAFYILLGMCRGFLVSLLGVVGVVCAAAAGHLWAAPAGDLLRDRFGVDPLVATGLGGALVFLAVTLAFSIATGLIRQRRRRRKRAQGGSSLSLVSRAGGGTIGLAVGLLLVLVLLWTYDALRGGLPGLGLTDLSGTRSTAVMREVVDTGARQVLRGRMEEGQSTALASAISTPGDSVEHLAAVLEEPVILALLRDLAFRDDVLSGDADRIAENRAFLNVLVDTNLTGRLLEMGLVPEPYDPVETGAILAGQLATLGSRVDDVLSDPEVADALEGLREDGVFEEENWKALVTDPRARFIAWQILELREDHVGTTDGETTKDTK